VLLNWTEKELHLCAPPPLIRVRQLAWASMSQMYSLRVSLKYCLFEEEGNVLPLRCELCCLLWASVRNECFWQQGKASI